MEHRGRLFEFCRRASVIEFKSAYECAEVLLEAMKLIEIGRQHVDSRMQIELGKLIAILKKEFNSLRRKDAPKLIIQLHVDDEEEEQQQFGSVTGAADTWSVLGILPPLVLPPALGSTFPEQPPQLSTDQPNPHQAPSRTPTHQTVIKNDELKNEPTALSGSQARANVKKDSSTRPAKTQQSSSPTSRNAINSPPSSVAKSLVPVAQASQSAQRRVVNHGGTVIQRTAPPPPRPELNAYAQYDHHSDVPQPPPVQPLAEPVQNYMPLRPNMYNEYQPRGPMEPPMYNWMMPPMEMNVNYGYAPQYQAAAPQQPILFDPPGIPPPLMSRRNMMAYQTAPYYHPSMMQQFPRGYDQVPQHMVLTPTGYTLPADPMNMWPPHQQRPGHQNLDVYRLGENQESHPEDPNQNRNPF